MKMFVLLSALLVAGSVSAGSYGNSYSSNNNNGGLLLANAGYSNSGSSSQFRNEDNYGNYAFGYDESHATGGSTRHEEESNGVRRGSYSLHDADGRRRMVNYVADASGFHATVETNEPGMEPKSPADVIVNMAGYQSQPAAVQTYQAPVAAPLPLPQLASYPMALPAVQRSYSAVKTAPAPVQLQVQSYPVAAAAPLPAPISYPAPRPMPIQAAGYQMAPRPLEQAYGTLQLEAPTPRAFSYSFGTSHMSPANVYRQATQYQAPRASNYVQQQQLATSSY